MGRRGLQGLVLVMLLGVGGAYYYLRTHRGVVRAEAQEPPDTGTQPPPRDHLGSGWNYYQVVDPLVNDVTFHARLLGNRPGGDGPSAPGTLELSASKRYGNRVSISFPKVPDACQANACQVRLGWDSVLPVPFDYVDISDAHVTAVQMTDYDKFVTAAAKATLLTVVASFGMPRDTILTFTVTGFNPARLK